MNIKQIEKDIQRIDEVLQKGTFKQLKDINQFLVGTYEKIIRETMHAWKRTDNEVDSYNRMNPSKRLDILTEEQLMDNYKFNLEMIKSRMLLSLPNETETSPATVINVSSNSNAENHNKVDIQINITYEDVKDQIRAMDNILDDDAINEILAKIDELEKIIESNDKKNTKWKKSRNIGKWILDKSVDVGIALLPLFLKINQ